MQAATQIGIHDFIHEPAQWIIILRCTRSVEMCFSLRASVNSYPFLRAYVSNPSVLILDEATSSVDPHSERMIQFATDRITKDRTSIIIAHRLTTVQKADTIVVMEKGKIVEKGTHKSLLQNEGGYYKNLFEKQFSETETASL